MVSVPVFFAVKTNKSLKMYTFVKLNFFGFIQVVFIVFFIQRILQELAKSLQNLLPISFPLNDCFHSALKLI